MSVFLQVDMSPGERQVLRVLTALQYLAEVGPKSPPPGHIAYSIQWIMRPLEQMEISFMPHAMLGYGTLIEYFDQNGCIMCRHIITTLQHMLSRGYAST